MFQKELGLQLHSLTWHENFHDSTSTGRAEPYLSAGWKSQTWRLTRQHCCNIEQWTDQFSLGILLCLQSGLCPQASQAQIKRQMIQQWLHCAHFQYRGHLCIKHGVTINHISREGCFVHCSFRCCIPKQQLQALLVGVGRESSWFVQDDLQNTAVIDKIIEPFLMLEDVVEILCTGSFFPSIIHQQWGSIILNEIPMKNCLWFLSFLADNCFHSMWVEIVTMQLIRIRVRREPKHRSAAQSGWFKANIVRSSRRSIPQQSIGLYLGSEWSNSPLW